MDLEENKPQQPGPGMSSQSPQYTTPRRQMYATTSPAVNFPQTPAPVRPLGTNRSVPKDHFGVPIVLAKDLKGDIVMANKMGLHPQMATQLFEESRVRMHIAMADTFADLKQKYRSQSSMSGKRVAVVGPLPYILTKGNAGEKFLALPAKLAKYMKDAGGKRGQVNFPMLNDNKVPLFATTKNSVRGENMSPMGEHYVGEDIVDLSGWTAPLVMILGLTGMVLVYHR